MGLKIALQKEREKNPPGEELSFEERIANEINENKEFWLEKVNIHLENILDKAKRDKKRPKHMVELYYSRN